MVKGLKPLYDCNSKIVILGSLPSVTSIEKQEYYYNPSNHFWRILKGIFKDDSTLNTYKEKMDFLYKYHIALWDVIKCANRKGSLDSNIKNEEYNNIDEFINKTGIKEIYVNGQKAEKSLNNYMKEKNIIIPYKLLPSSSSANTRYTLEEKINKWKIIKKN